MELAEGIRKIGFRRWYERQLVESHLFLVSSLLCLIMVLALVEGFSLRAPAWEIVVRLLAAAAGIVLCEWALRRYLAMLRAAFYVSDRAVCRKCAVYAGLQLTEGAGRGTPGRDEGSAEAPAAVGVRCRKCGHAWTIEQQ